MNSKSVCLIIKRNLLKRFFCILLILSALPAYSLRHGDTNDTGHLDKGDFIAIEYLIARARSEKMLYNALDKRDFFEKMYGLCFAGGTGCAFGSACASLFGCDNQTIRNLQVAAGLFFAAGLSSCMPVYFQNKIIDVLLEQEKEFQEGRLNTLH